MTDFYNAFVLMLIFGVPPSKLNILAVDAHPEGTLDPVWMTLFGKFIRAGRLQQPVVFQNLIWGLLGYFSPLNEHERTNVPYLDEFREFFLSRHNISTKHTINCSKLNVLFIWRRDYVAHPRNPHGSVVRKFENEDEMMQEVQENLGTGANVQGMQLDAMPMTDQLRAVAKADVLIGMHGAGLSHILFLPATSGVIEFKPEYSNPALQHFKCMAEWRNLPYTIWHNYDPANERASHKTYIPRSVMKSTFKSIHKQICQTKED
uniref:Glycosyltransferase 61 catalytic domain-containing protein n=1 Tax=Arion vulgaris TaxID=1028688 RepID=A0A0B6ZPS1_9EUPU